MIFLNYMFIILGVIYGALNMIAGFSQLKQREISLWSSVIMIVGGALIFVSVIWIQLSYAIYNLLLGLIIIHITTINNGIKLYGKINRKHHVIRFAISIILIILIIIYT